MSTPKTVVKTPWTPEQVDALNAYQNAKPLHPYTCPENHPAILGNGQIKLNAWPDGWKCSSVECNYKQDWSHDFTIEWGKNVDPNYTVHPCSNWPASCNCDDPVTHNGH